jgi:hypothetical protein
VTGTGTTNTLPKFTGASTIGNSLLTDNGTTLAYGNNIISVGGSNTSEKYLEFGSSNGAYYVGGTSSEHYIFGQGDKPLRLYTAGTLKATLSSSGNLGLGVTPSAWASDRKAYQVGQGASFVSGTSAEFLTISSNTFYDGTNYKYIANGSSTLYVQTSGIHWWSNAPSGTAGNNISFTQAMTLNASGRLLLNTTSDNGARLQVNGDITTGDASTISSVSNFLVVRAATNLILDGNTGSVNIRTNNSDKLVIANSGSATFSSSVTANYISSIISSSSNASPLILQNTAGWGSSQITSISVKDASDVVGAIGWKYDGVANVDMLFHSLYNGAYKTVSNVVMTVKGTGNVGIGTTSPDRLLTLAPSSGDAYINLRRPIGASTQSTLEFNTAGTNDWLIRTDDTSANLKFYSYGFNNYALILTRSSGAATFSSSVTASSFTAGSGTNQSILQNGNLLFYNAGTSAKFIQLADDSSTINAIGFSKSGSASTTYFPSGNVGIGTDSPNRKLVVQGTFTSNEQLLYLKQGDDNGFSFNLDAAVTGNLMIRGVNSGTETASLLTIRRDNGNVGINTTTDAGFKLDVNGTGRFSGDALYVYGTGNIEIGRDTTYSIPYMAVGFGGRSNGFNRIYGARDTTDGIFISSATGRGIFLLTNGNTVSALTLASGGAATFASLAGSGTRMVVADASGALSTQAIGSGAITGTGTTNYLPKFTGASTIGNSIVFDNGTNVGIGTISPNARLSIEGGSNTPTSYGTLLVKNSSETGISFGASSTSYAWIQGNIYGSTYNLNLVLNAQGGNVGIATDSPTQGRLVVVADSSAITLALRARTGDDFSQVNFLNNAGNNINGIIGVQKVGTNGGSMYFFTKPDGGSVSEAMRITASGRVLIGTPPPAESTFQLDVNGTGRFSDNFLVSKNQNGNTGITISNTTSGTGSSVEYTLTSNSAAGGAALGKYSSTTNAYKIISASTTYLYNGTAGDIGILNDHGSGAIKLAAGGSSSAHLTISSTGAATFSSSVAALTNLAFINTNASQAGFVADYTGTGALKISFSAYNDTMAIYNETNGYAIVNFVRSTKNLIFNPTGGNVLIGTTTDSGFKLFVNGNAKIANQAQANDFFSSNDGLNVGGYNLYSQTISGAMGILGHNVRASSSVANQVNVVNGGWISSMIKQYYNDGITFHTDTTVYSAGAIYPMAATERMRITSGGNVLINQTGDDGYKLSVNGVSRSKGEAILGDFSNLTDFGQAGMYATNSSFVDGFGALVLSSRADAARPIIFTTSNGTLATERMRITSGGNVGIGTNSPGTYDAALIGTSHRFLNVQSTSNTYAVATLAGNQSSADSRIGYLTFVNDNNSSSYKYSAWIGSEVEGATANQLGGRLIFSTTGNASSAGPIERMRITSGGNVLIGTATDNGAKFQVNSSNSSAFRISRTGSSDFGFEIGGATFGLYDYTNSVYRWRTNGNNLLLAESNGNVGIGTNSPATKLSLGGYNGARLAYVNGTGNTFDANGITVPSSNTNNAGIGGGIDLTNNTYSVGAYSPLISFSSLSSNSAYNNAYAGIWGVLSGQGVDANWVVGHLAFGTGGGAGITERMRITSGGNVGIGTDSPSTRLDVRNAGAVTLSVRADGITGDSVARLQHDAIIRSTWTANRTTSQVVLAALGTFPLAFHTNGVERINITTGGNVLIGTSTTPTPVSGVAFPLTVSSSAATRIRIDSTNASPNSGVGLYANGVQKFSFAMYGTDSDFTIYNDALLAPALTVKGTNSNVLIGTTADNANKLRVNGVGFFDQGIRTGNPYGSTTNNVLIGRFLTETASVNGSIRVQIGTRYYNIAAQDLGEVPS